MTIHLAGEVTSDFVRTHRVLGEGGTGVGAGKEVGCGDGCIMR